ncbi:MAG: tetratricopeptide repeat protein [Gammaproteobacteria bacterium]|nr:tetratricopeptide repeat protein [Gammaproteobacteria bacterium]
MIKVNRQSGYFLLVLLMLFLAGCSTSGQKSKPLGETSLGKPQAEQALPKAAELPPGRVEEKVTQVTSNAAVVSLWRESELARSSQQFDRAANALERALRIVPKDAVLWSRLAEIRLYQNQYAQAENLAAKSSALAGRERTLLYRNWLLTEQARQARGDKTGAKEAQRQAQLLK